MSIGPMFGLPAAAIARHVVAAWREVVGTNNPKFVSELTTADELAAALSVLGRNGDSIDALRIGSWMRSNRGKTIDGLKVAGILDPHSKLTRWYLTDPLHDDL